MEKNAVTARAFRAARAWAGLSQGEIASAMGMSVMTIKRIESGEREPSPPERMFAARYCDVPEDFMLHGFNDEAQA